VTDCCANGERNVNFKRSRTENDVHQVSDTLGNLKGHSKTIRMRPVALSKKKERLV
jgi:hypothetical protein